MLNKYTIIGLIVGCIISGLGVASMIDFLVNPIDIMDFDDNFGVGESTTFVFQAPESSLQKLMILLELAILIKLDLMHLQTLFKR